MEKNEILKNEEVVKEDGAGRFKTPPQKIIIDYEGNTKEVEFEIVRPQNPQIYTKAYLNFATQKDITDFAIAVLPKMINKPAEARDIEFFEYDPEMLAELCTLIIEIMGKSKEKNKRKLRMRLS